MCSSMDYNVHVYYHNISLILVTFLFPWYAYGQRTTYKSWFSSVYHVGSQITTQVIRLGSKYPYLLNHLTENIPH